MYRLGSSPFIGEVSGHRFEFQMRNAYFIECRFGVGWDGGGGGGGGWVRIRWIIYIILHNDKPNNSIYQLRSYLSPSYFDIMSFPL